MEATHIFLKQEYGEDFLEKSLVFVRILLEWNQVHSFTNLKTEKQIIDNIIDSVFPLHFLNHFENFVDVGTGAGFPGLLLALAKPQVKAFLIEPKTKRVAFLNFVVNTLNLNNITIVHKRAEDFLPKIDIDLITSRAVADFKILFGVTSHFAKNETEYLFFKGSNFHEQLDEKLALRCEIIEHGIHRKYIYFKRSGLI